MHKRNETFTLPLDKDETYLVKVAVADWLAKHPDDAFLAVRIRRYLDGSRTLAIVSDTPFGRVDK